MDREALYRRLPRPLQSAALNLEGWRIQRRRYGGRWREIAEAVQGREFAGADALQRFRDRRVADFVSRAVSGVAWWRDRFRTLGIDPRSVDSLDALRQLPVLEKAEVRATPDRFRASDVPPDDVITAHTSGTTGSGLIFPLAIAAEQEQWAVWWRYRRAHGIHPSEWCLYFGGRSVVPLDQRGGPWWRVNRVGRQVLFSAYHLSDDTAPAFLEHCRATGHRWMHGYPSQLALLAEYAMRLGIRLPAIRWITVGAESLLPAQARSIAQAFGVRPIQHYGMAEGVANISECPKGLLHVDEDFAAVEFLPLGERRYRLLGTNLSNPAFPLLRYAVGDVVALGDAAPCPCGRAGRTVEAIDGRIEDYVLTADGVRIGRLDHVFKDMVRVSEAQVRQRVPGAITVLVVPGAGYGRDDEAMLRREFATRLGTGMTVDIQVVDRIARGPNGKLRFVVSETP